MELLKPTKKKGLLTILIALLFVIALPLVLVHICVYTLPWLGIEEAHADCGAVITTIALYPFEVAGNTNPSIVPYYFAS